MGREDKATWKANYFLRLIQLLEEFPKCFIVGVDNVGSSQMQQIRHSLRQDAQLLMGKNTMIRKAIRGHLESNPALEKLLPHIKGNVGFVFTNDDLSAVKKILEEQRVAAPAKIGSVSPNDVFIPAMLTGLEPSQTSFFQALNIPTKINKGQIEIVSDVHLLKPNQKVGASEANLLGKLDIKPFSYGLVVKTVYDKGAIYDPKVLSITDEDILSKFHGGVKNLAAVSMALHQPNIASIPHMMSNAFKNTLSVALAADFQIKQTEKLKAAATAPVVSHKPVETKPVETKPVVAEPTEEPVEEGFGGLFD